MQKQPMNVEALVDQVALRLEQSDVSFGQGVDNPWDEAAWIVCKTLDQEPYGNGEDETVDEEGQDRVWQQVSRRIEQRIPFAYLVNEAWFVGLPFYVDSRVLIPRSYFSEWIPQCFEPWIDSSRITNILDLCTGSGCIAIACALAFENASVVASDISQDALDVAAINIKNYQLGERVTPMLGDGLGNLTGPFDLIVCNPPYVSDRRMATLPAEFVHEPGLALHAGDDGLEFIVPLLRDAEQVLSEDGVLLVEAGSASAALEEKFPEVPFTWLGTAYDETVIFLITAEELRRSRRYFAE